VEFSDVINRDSANAKVGIECFSVLVNRFRFGSTEKSIKNLINEIFMEKILQTENDNLFLSFDSGFSRRQVSVNLFRPSWILSSVVSLVAVH
jgi:hypothetical protein